MNQLDWISESYNEFNEPPDEVHIWRSASQEDEPDLYCDVHRVSGQYVDFYVNNGAWYGQLDLANKSMLIYCPIGDKYVSYRKCVFYKEGGLC